MIKTMMRYSLGGALIGTSMIFGTTAANAACPSTEVRFGEIMGYRPTNDIMIVAHRGYWGANNRVNQSFPENSTDAIVAADVVCMDGVELDIKASSDGVPHILHDFRLGRTTNYPRFNGLPLYDPSTDGLNALKNPPIANFDANFVSRLQLLSPNRRLITQYKIPALRDLMLFYQARKLTVPILFDVKNSTDVINTHRLVTGTIPGAKYKMGIKVNVTLYTTPAAFYRDSPNLFPIPVFTTNMLGAINLEQAFGQWYGVGAMEINVKQPNGLLANYKRAAQRKGIKVGMFQAIPDKDKNTGEFYYNTGQCCYKLSSLYFNRPDLGYVDTADMRGDLNFIYNEGFGFITTDDPNKAAADFGWLGKRRSHPVIF